MDNENKKVPPKIDNNDQIDKKSLDNTQSFVVQNQNIEQTARLRTIKSEDIEFFGKKNAPKKKNRIKRMRMSSEYKKRYMILSAVVVLIFILLYQFVKVKDIDFSKLATEVEKNVNIKDYEKGNDLTIRKLYSINKNEVDSYVSFAPKSNMLANEIFIAKVKPEFTDSVMKRIQARVSAQSNSFKNYAPDQYKIISGSELYKKGDYIYFVSSPNVKSINDSIKKSYK